MIKSCKIFGLLYKMEDLDRTQTCRKSAKNKWFKNCVTQKNFMQIFEHANTNKHFIFLF